MSQSGRHELRKGRVHLLHPLAGENPLHDLAFPVLAFNVLDFFAEVELVLDRLPQRSLHLLVLCGLRRLLLIVLLEFIEADVAIEVFVEEFDQFCRLKPRHEGQTKALLWAGHEGWRSCLFLGVVLIAPEGLDDELGQLNRLPRQAA